MTATGCEALTGLRPSSEKNQLSSEQDQIQRLIRQSKRYDELSKKQRMATCKRLKLDYETEKKWQTAWLLAYTLNDNFNCIKQNKTMELLKAIQSDLGMSTQLQWLNNNQILLLEQVAKLKDKNKFLRNQLKNTTAKLNQAEEDLKKEHLKIEALKAIETNINKKLDNE